MFMFDENEHGLTREQAEDRYNEKLAEEVSNVLCDAVEEVS